MDMFSALLGKSLSGGGGSEPVLVSKSITENGIYDPADDNADGYSSVSVDVPNTYTASDEGKVVSNGELVSQTSSSVTQNGTVDTTLISSLDVNVSASGNVAYKLSGTNANDLYICECNDYIYIFGSSIWNGSGTSIGHFDYTAPNEFDVSKIGSSINGYLMGGNYGTNFITGSISVSGSTITISFNTTQFPKNQNIWTIVQITKST